MNTTIQNQITNAIDSNRAQIVQFLQKLIRFNSITGNEGEIQSFIASFLKNRGFCVDIFEPKPANLSRYTGYVEPEHGFEGRPNVVGVWKGSGGGRSLLLNGHVDTVPIEPVGRWQEHPLSGVVIGNNIVGRGSSDMKGGLAAMTMAACTLQDLNLQPKGDIILEYVVDEERTGLGTLACVDRGYHGDAGICCETSDLVVMPACIGRMWFTIHVQGKPTGIAARWEGVSAIDKAIKLVQAVEDLTFPRISRQRV